LFGNLNLRDMLFYYTEREKIESGEEMELIIKRGYSFDTNKVLMTYPTENGLAIVLEGSADKLNPVDYQYKIDPATKQKVPVKITKFEITSEPIVVELKVKEEILAFFSLTGGPQEV
jgi:hypothetical protein